MPLQATSGAASYDAFGGGVAVVPTYIEDIFGTFLYTGNGSTQTITNGIDLAGKGGMTWIKQRNQATSHRLFDTARGVQNSLASNSTAGTASFSGYLTAFNSNGFSVGSANDVNESGFPLVSWTFRKQPKFFDVVTWTGDGTGNINIPHNLGSVPGCIMLKKTSAALDWYVYHRDLNYPNAGSPQNNTLKLNTTDAGLNSTAWQSGPTSTYFPVLGSAFNASGATYVAYLFAHNAGGFGLTGTDNVISCGSFTVDGAGGASVSLGYEPQWLLTKRTNSTGNWFVTDTMRGWSYSNGLALRPNTSDAENNYWGTFNQPNATGFTIGAGALGAGDTYIYIAIRRGPMKVPTSGTSVFATQATRDNGTAGGNSFTSGFPVDLMIQLSRAGSAHGFQDRLRGFTQVLESTNTAAESGPSSFKGDNMTGVYGVAANSNWGAELFRRAPSFFDEVCYTGTGALTSFNHNLAAAPELLIVKKRNGADSWWVYYTNYGPTNYGEGNLNSTASVSFSPEYTNDWDMAAKPTATVFTQGQYSHTNASGATYVAYLFATASGVSKVGSYTGTGTTKQIDCGFTGGARFVLIKKTSGTGSWYVWDVARGISSGNDPYLLLNSTAAEVTSTDYIDAYSAGFEISSTAPAEINASGGSYIFFAVA